MASLSSFRAASRSSTTLLRTTPKQSIRAFGSSSTRPSNEGIKTDKYPDSEHATDKKDKLDVQSNNSAKGREYVFPSTIIEEMNRRKLEDMC